MDVDSSIMNQARQNLEDLANVKLVQSDITNVKLPTDLHVIFSNAALHWVHDHIRVFQHFWNMLNCYGDMRGQLLIQCGGYGNLRRVHALIRQVMKLNEFKMHFTVVFCQAQ